MSWERLGLRDRGRVLKGGYCLICIGRSPGMPYAVTQLLASVTYYTFQIIRKKSDCYCLGAVRHARKKCILNFMLCPQWTEFHKAFLNMWKIDFHITEKYFLI